MSDFWNDLHNALLKNNYNAVESIMDIYSLNSIEIIGTMLDHYRERIQDIVEDSELSTSKKIRKLTKFKRELERNKNKLIQEINVDETVNPPKNSKEFFITQYSLLLKKELNLKAKLNEIEETINYANPVNMINIVEKKLGNEYDKLDDLVQEIEQKIRIYNKIVDDFTFIDNEKLESIKQIIREINSEISKLKTPVNVSGKKHSKKRNRKASKKGTKHKKTQKKR